MIKTYLTVIIVLILAGNNYLFAQELSTPLEKNNWERVTSYNELISFLDEIKSIRNDFIIETIAESVEGRSIPAVKISSSVFGEDENKVRALIFAQQHGNEQSGKEGALLLLKRFALGQLDKLLSKLDVIIIPQVNPDGSEKNVRVNGNGADLNRNHLLLTQPETQGLHNLFYQYLPEVTMDVHEYFPYSESWKDFGYYKIFDEQIGMVTNPNISAEIKEFCENVFYPFINNFLTNSGYSFHNYLVGGPPNSERIRHSTVDINDGRQSFGILNTLSFILEGKNGKDYLVENIKKRSEGQEAAMIGLLYFAFNNADEIKELVAAGRKKLLNPSSYEKIAIRMEHYGDGKPLTIPVFSVANEVDTVITIDEYHPVVKTVLEVEKPYGYLIPKNNSALTSFIERNKIEFLQGELIARAAVHQYYIHSIDLITLEGSSVPDPQVELKEIEALDWNDYIFIPTAQLKGNRIALAFEPQSMLGLATYDEFKDMLEAGGYYPILRVTRK